MIAHLDLRLQPRAPLRAAAQDMERFAERQAMSLA
jgi:hypothetical protein